MASIFIQIASYRDLELSRTVQDLIDKSSGTHQLTIGVHSCALDSDVIGLEDVRTRQHANLKIIQSIAPNNLGVGASRHIANSLYSDEDYYLQVDSHTRFTENWDLTAIKSYLWYVDQGVENPLLTMYPPNYSINPDGVDVLEFSNTFQQTRISFNESPDRFKVGLIPSQTAVSMPKGCFYTSSIAAGLVFTSGKFSAIQPNSDVAFWGEEILMAARAFTSGFTLVALVEPLIWHLYFGDQTVEEARRHHAWADFPTLWEKLDAQSKCTVENILTLSTIGPGALGSVRTLDDYGIFAGLDFKTREITKNLG